MRALIFKPRSGELSYSNGEGEIANLVQYTRDVQAFRYFQFWLDGERLWKGGQVRVRIPPVAEIVLSAGGKNYGAGSIQVFQEGYITLKEFMMKHPDRWETFRKSPEWAGIEADTRLIDYIEGNHDRLPNHVYSNGNYGNLMVPAEMATPADLRVILIDNGLGRPGLPYFNQSNLSPKNRVSPALRQAIFDFDAISFRRNETRNLSPDGIEDEIHRTSEAQRYLRDP